VTHEVTGLLVPVDQPASLAYALRRLEADPALRERLGEAARCAARERFRQEVVIEKLCALYETMAGRAAAAPG
jgi:glycosyltransferase involved in cell wall biosynthesis